MWIELSKEQIKFVKERINVQDAIIELQKLGPMPESKSTEVDMIKKYESLLFQVMKPITAASAVTLLDTFEPDDFFGLSWTLVHLIETAPGWPMLSLLRADDLRDGIESLRLRAENA